MTIAVVGGGDGGDGGCYLNKDSLFMLKKLTTLSSGLKLIYLYNQVSIMIPFKLLNGNGLEHVAVG